MKLPFRKTHEITSIYQSELIFGGFQQVETTVRRSVVQWKATRWSGLKRPPLDPFDE